MLLKESLEIFRNRRSLGHSDLQIEDLRDDVLWPLACELRFRGLFLVRKHGSIARKSDSHGIEALT